MAGRIALIGGLCRGALSRAAVVALGLAMLVAVADAAERVTVRAGLHDGYGRLVFDWVARVGYRASISGRLLTIRFDRAIDPAFGNVGTELRAYMANIERAADDRTVRARLVDDFTLRSSRLGNRVVVDLLKAGTEPAAGPDAGRASDPEAPHTTRAAPPTRLGPLPPPTVRRPSAAESESATQPVVLSIRTERHRNYGRLVFGWPRQVGFDVDRHGQSVTIRFDAPASVDLAALRRDLPSQISAAITHPSPRGLEIGLVIPPDAQLRYFHNEASVVFDVVSRRKDASLAARSPNAAAARDGHGKKARKNRQAVLPFVSVEAAQSGRDSILKFNWREPVAAAVFRRDGSLWISFDRPARLDVGAIQVVANGIFRKVRQHSDGKSVYIQLPMNPHLRAAVRREGTVWVLKVGPDIKSAVRNLPMEARRSAENGLALVIGAHHPGRIMGFRDRIVGDAVYAVPLPDAGAGIEPLRRFPEFELLQSPQGLAVRPLDDSVRVRVDDDDIIISRPGGLTISRDALQADGKKPHGGDNRLLDLAAWQHGPLTDYEKIRLELLQYIVDSKGARRNAARLGLARFYAAHGMGAEALGVLETMLHDEPSALRDPGIRALRGLANYLIGHYAEANRDFSDVSLAGIQELYPWRAGIAAARGDWAGAYQLFADTDAVIAALPSRFAVDLGLLAAEAALSVGAKDIAEARLLALESLPASSGQLDYLTYLRGHLYKQKGDTEKAIALWKSVVENGNRPTRAKASFSIINTRLESGAIKVPEAIDRLEALKFAWRNSVFEFDLLNKLGQLYAQNHDLREALVTLREAVTLYKDIKGAQALTQRMRALFRKFYLDGEADELEPVVALGLYNEFRELTPTNEDGERMVRKLAERLIKVDLLSEAAGLLDHQVQYRLKGVEKSKVGTRLAQVLLLDRKPLKALAALDKTRDDQIPAQLVERRRHLRAAALMDAHRYDDALKGIAKDFSEESDMLRAQIFWRAGDWPKASRALARLTGMLDPGKLRGRDAELLLRRAVALGLAGDRKGMQFLRERFGAAMEKSKRAAAFKAVAGGKLLQPENYEALARRASELDTFRAFMKSLNQDTARPKPPAQTAAIN